MTRPRETAALIEAFLADESRQIEPSSLLSRTANGLKDIVPTSEGGHHQS
jgi:hypothetical protein